VLLRAARLAPGHTVLDIATGTGLAADAAAALVGPAGKRFIRWSRMGVFSRIFAALAGEVGEPDRLIIDSTHLKAHRTAVSLLKRGRSVGASAAPRAG
jgi:transposase